jgi:ATP-dependent Lhr-like helicase
VLLASTDPASPYGASVPWPERDSVRFARSVGTHVILVDGALVAYVGRAASSLTTLLPEAPSARREVIHAIAAALALEVDSGRRRALLLVDVDNGAAASSELAEALVSHGFTPSARGLLRRPSLAARGRVTLPGRPP